MKLNKNYWVKSHYCVDSFEDFAKIVANNFLVESTCGKLPQMARQ